MKQPLVSIGIPTFNRPKGLKRTLESITKQSYGNIEIIVSDNSSDDCYSKEIKEIIANFQVKYSFIRFFSQTENRGPIKNFQFVLEESTGEFFMWAADDDYWGNTFIEKCMTGFSDSGQEFVAVVTEAQYFHGDERFEFFSEGKPFYHFYSKDSVERLKHMLKFNYGNLFYSLFKKEALFDEGKSFFHIIDLKSLNEIPMFLFVASKGNWRVLPEVEFYKEAPFLTYENAKWEKQGGVLPQAVFTLEYLNKVFTVILKYHCLALRDMLFTIRVLKIKHFINRVLLKTYCYLLIVKHFSYYFFRKRSKAF